MSKLLGTLIQDIVDKGVLLGLLPIISSSS